MHETVEVSKAKTTGRYKCRWLRPTDQARAAEYEHDHAPITLPHTRFEHDHGDFISVVIVRAVPVSRKIAMAVVDPGFPSQRERRGRLVGHGLTLRHVCYKYKESDDPRGLQ